MAISFKAYCLIVAMMISSLFVSANLYSFGITENGKKPLSQKNVNPLDLEFHRLAVRRFIFSNNINLSELIPSEIVAFESMHPAFSLSDNDKAKNDTLFAPQIYRGRLLFDKACQTQDACVYVGAVNPYATYEIDVESISKEDPSAEIGLELAQFGLRNRVQVIARSWKKGIEVFLRLYKDGLLVKEELYERLEVEGPFVLRAQLYGRSLGVCVSQDGVSKYLGHVDSKEHFGDIIDPRKISENKRYTFNIVSNLKGRIEVNKACSYLSPGIGQADIRLISYEDLSPYMDGNRLWFTFSCRGMDITQSAQGVLSLDPSVFDIRFEGMIVFDHGDGMLRNDYASHLFFDRNANEWRAYVCDFGGSKNVEGRTGSGLITAQSPKDPRRGFSVMKAKRVEAQLVEGHNEDPCVFYDKNTQKWHLLTSAFVNNNITSRTYESDTWDGVYTPIALPIESNSTGTSIQKIGDTHYAFMGGHGNLRVHSYPDLKELGELNLDLQPHWPKPAGRVWASVVPLPEGFPYRYVLLTMDRPNFPGIKAANWTYGALYFYGANRDGVSDGWYEFDNIAY